MEKKYKERRPHSFDYKIILSVFFIFTLLLGCARQNTEIETPAGEPFSATISISVKNAQKYDKNLPDYFLNSKEYNGLYGDSLYDALKTVCADSGLTLEAQGNYIIEIGGLREHDYKAASGWVYTVNGELINKPASKYILQDGDVAEVYFVTGPNDKA